MASASSCSEKNSTFFQRIYEKFKGSLKTVIISVLIAFLLQRVLRRMKSHSQSETDRFDWHDWDQIDDDALRAGIGEHGVPTYLQSYPPSSKELNDTHGLNGYLSDQIALNRALMDLRPKQCIDEKYSFNLPNVSVIIAFHNAHLSTLLRTCYSVWFRSPAEILTEIILVDDASTIEDLGNELTDYITAHLPIVKLIRLKERSGLIKARTIGALAAKSEILAFLDSHCEVYHNWLPPLLDGMAQEDYRTVMLPTIDLISNNTFAYTRRIANNAARTAYRGMFNLKFDYVDMDAVSHVLNPSKPFETPIMPVNVFVITKTFFWEIGAYDAGMDDHGGEHYELSLKIWLCGGRMLETACSRVGHINAIRPDYLTLNVKQKWNQARNLKRITDVWLDEYKPVFYDRRKEFLKIDAGDISEQIALRYRLRCKSYRWFLENVAFDFLLALRAANKNIEVEE